MQPVNAEQEDMLDAMFAGSAGGAPPAAQAAASNAVMATRDRVSMAQLPVIGAATLGS